MKPVHATLWAYCLTISPAAAATDHELSASLQNCYLLAATVYGLQSCNPPPMMRAAVRGKCAKEESDLSNNFMAEFAAQGPDSARNIAMIAMAKVEEMLGPKIESWILDAQIKAGGCSKPGGR